MALVDMQKSGKRGAPAIASLRTLRTRKSAVKLAPDSCPFSSRLLPLASTRPTNEQQSWKTNSGCNTETPQRLTPRSPCEMLIRRTGSEDPTVTVTQLKGTE